MTKYCSVEGCDKILAAKGLCGKHYSRLVRTGTTDAGPNSHFHAGRKERERKPYAHSSGYLMDPGFEWHPLANTQGRVYQHRRVYYESVDGELFPCYWCGKELEDWTATHIDHVDSDKRNNKPENLVASCNSCNSNRGAMLNLLNRARPDVLGQLKAMVEDC